MSAIWGRLMRVPDVHAPNVEDGWVEAGDWRRSWEMPLNLVREGHNQDVLIEMCGPLRARGYLIAVAAELIPEPGNEYDKNAIAVFVDGRMVGYVRRDLACTMSPALRRMKLPSLTLCGVMRGGSFTADKIGVHVWLNRRLSPGPKITMTGDVDAVDIPWPPWPSEGTDG